MFRIRRKDFLRLLAASPFAALVDVARAADAAAPAAPSESEQFFGRILADNAAAFSSFGAYIGDRLGIFKAMVAVGPATVEELARQTRLNERYLKEWLGLMVTAKYVDYHPPDKKYSLPASRATVLLDANSPFFLGGYLELLACVFAMPKVIEGFRGGKGPVSDDYPVELWEGIERSTRPVYENFLIPDYLATLPDVVERLKHGGSTLDVGCGGGVASIAMAEAYPRARVFGVDVFAPSVEKARANARAAGVAERARFEVFDGVTLPAHQFDLITICYSIHHVADPVTLLASARNALLPDGSLVILEGNVANDLEGNINTFSNWLYGASLFYCTSSTLAEGGPGYGALINEVELRQLSQKAGFTRFRRLPVKSEFDALYETKA